MERMLKKCPRPFLTIKEVATGEVLFLKHEAPYKNKG